MNEKGFAQIIVVLLLLFGLGVGVLLVQQKTNFFPKADQGTLPLTGIGVNLSAGGAINLLELNGQNIIDTNDCGRLIQIALIEHLADDSEKKVPALCVLPGMYTVNPTQGCDGCGHSSPILEGTDANYIKVQPVNWVRNGELSDFIIEQRISQLSNLPRVYNIQYTITHTGADSHFMGMESPAIFLKDPYKVLKTYDADKPWTSDANIHTESPTQRLNFTTTEHWAAVVDPQTNQGLTIISAELNNWSIWPGANNTPNSNFITLGRNHYFAPNESLSFNLYLVVGNWQDGRNQAYQLINHNNNFRVGFNSYPNTTLIAQKHLIASSSSSTEGYSKRVLEFQFFSPNKVSGVKQWWNDANEPTNWINTNNPIQERGWVSPRDDMANGEYFIKVRLQDSKGNQSQVFNSEVFQIGASPTPTITPSNPPTPTPRIPSLTPNPPTTTPNPGKVCAQLISYGIDPRSGKCQQFPTPCDVPQGWKSVISCPRTTINPSTSPTIPTSNPVQPQATAQPKQNSSPSVSACGKTGILAPGYTLYKPTDCSDSQYLYVNVTGGYLTNACLDIPTGFVKSEGGCGVTQPAIPTPTPSTDIAHQVNSVFEYMYNYLAGLFK